MSIYSKEFLDYYLKQIAYLREKGTEFSDMFPKVASQIDMSGNESSDPQVERILESFAFLTARLQKMLDEQSLAVPYFLLSSLNPYMLLPPPSMGIVHNELSPLDEQNGVSKFMKKGSTLVMDDKNFGRMKFSAVFDTAIYPFKIYSETAPLNEMLPDYPGNTEGKLAICINVSAVSKEVMKDIFFDNLRFYIDGDYSVTSSIYDGLSLNLDDVLLTDQDFKSIEHLSNHVLELSGFGKEENAIPLRSANSDHFRLLQEYFAFPSKFMFFNVKGLLRRPEGQSFNIVLVLNKDRIKRIKVVQDTFRINATPVVNLFYQQAQPINLSSKNLNYTIVSNHIHGQNSEFYTVDLVQFMNYQENKAEKILPYHAISPNDDHSQIYWSVQPTPGLSKQNEQWLISLLNKTGDIQSIENSCLAIRLFCSNGHYVSNVKNGSSLSASGELGSAAIQFVTKPTENYKFYSNKLMWSLLCHYHFNFLNFNDPDSVLSNLKTVLLFMSPKKDKQTLVQIDGITKIRIEKTIRPNKEASWKGFSKHLEIHLYFEQINYTGISIALFTKVLFILLESKRSVNCGLSLIAHYGDLIIVHEK